MSKTLITWPHGSADGEREARKLHKLYEPVSHCVDGAALGGETSKDFGMLIVVGHRDEIEAKDTLKALAGCVTSLGIHFVILANCHSGATKTGGTLSDHNELWSPAQRLANATGAAVLATTRVLTFDEVGQGYGFTGDDHGITGINPSNNPSPLWREYRKQDDVDEITQGIGNL